MNRVFNLEPVLVINYAKLIGFIEKNSDMHWNQVCKYVDNNQFGHFSDRLWLCDRDDYEDIDINDPFISVEVDKWMNRFFKCHPELPAKIGILFCN